MPAIRCPHAPDCDYMTESEATVGEAILLIQMHEKAKHQQPEAPCNLSKADKVRRPIIKGGGTSEDWQYFTTRWKEYAAATKLAEGDKVLQLLECCDEELRRDLTRAAGGTLSEKTLTEVMQAIQKLAVREENAMIARFTLHQMIQDVDEPIRNFGARIKGQANVCKYNTECPDCQHSIDYTDEILRDVLVRGLADTDIQLSLLGEKNQDMTLEEMYKFVESKESGKRSVDKLTHALGANATRSSYSKAKNTQKEMPTPQRNQVNPDDICSYCGKRGHGKKAPLAKRASVCPAYGTKCKACNKSNHFKLMCRAETKVSNDDNNASFDHLCSANNDIATANDHGHSAIHSPPIVLEHHIFENLHQSWIKRSSQPQPFIDVHVTTSREDYESLGFGNFAKNVRNATLAVMADTGCQSSIAGFKAIKRLGFCQKDLIPVKVKMSAANETSLKIMGAVILRMSGMSPSGEAKQTRQIVYITDSTDKIYLSREGCIGLGLISKDFPTIGEAECIVDVSGSSCHHCDCPTRQQPPPRPASIPFPPTEENRIHLKEWLLNQYSSSAFNTCEHQPLPMMDGPPLRLMVDKNATPSACHKAIPVPLHWMEKVKADMDRDVQLGVIEPVPVGEPVIWCHRMVVTAKKNGDPRRTVDLQSLNRHAQRETHYTSSPFHQARTVPHGTKKTVLDAWNGYHSVPLHPDDRHYTTFITPWGRYRYCVAPQGYIASGDGYTRRYDEILANAKLSHKNYTKCIDDALIWSESIEDSFWKTVEWLEVAGKNGIILNPQPEKFEFAEDEVEFAGFEITSDSVRPCSKYLKAIREFPTPKNITDVRAWFGVINQVSYAFSMTEYMQPFRELLKPSTPFHWNAQLNDIFLKSKAKIVEEISEGVRIFDTSKPTCLATDWCKTGIGYVLSQKHCNCDSDKPTCCHNGWKVVLIGSRFTSPAESRYKPIEGEALAVAEGLDKTRFFVLGCSNLTVATDHKPLLKILSDRFLEDIPNARLRNLKEKTLRYRFKIVHIPGVKHLAADATSRYPSGSSDRNHLPLPDDRDEQYDPPVNMREMLSGLRCTESPQVNVDSPIHDSAIGALSHSSVTWQRVKQETATDNNMYKLLEMIEQDTIPNSRNSLPDRLREYFQFRNELMTLDGVILYKDRVVIPPSLRHEVIKTLHSAHQGVQAMISRAESSVFWPGITTAIQEVRATCGPCNRMAPSQPNAPPAPATVPEYPFQQICADYFNLSGSNYVIVVDRYTNWPRVERATEGSTGLIKTLREGFETYGIPEELSSDGGPEFTASQTAAFLEKWGVHHRLSSVAYPHSNTRAEIGVKTMKRMLTENTGPNGSLDTDAFAIAVLQYRNTPDPETKMSPAQMLFGHPIRDFIPILPKKYKPHRTWRESLAAREEALRNRHMKAAERWTEHTQRLPPLKVGDLVRIQNQLGNFPRRWDKTGRIVEVKQHDQYVVGVDGSGRVTLRNRKFLRKYTPVIRKNKQPRCLAEDLKYELMRREPNPSLPLTERTPVAVAPKNVQQVPSTPTGGSPQLPTVPNESDPESYPSENLTKSLEEMPRDDLPGPSLSPTVPATEVDTSTPAPRRSTREKKKPQRLIESDWTNNFKS